MELRPYEHLVVYDAMQVVDPTDDVPIRTYRPQVAAQVPLTGDDVTFKPGFVGQMRAFAAMCAGGDPGPGATLADAASALRLAEEHRRHHLVIPPDRPSVAPGVEARPWSTLTDR